MKKFIFLIIAMLGFSFIGCADKGLTITKCKSFENGICVAKEVKQVKECKKPLKIGNKTYCEE